MSFTYTATNPSTRDQVRRKIGDTQAQNPVFQDEEIDAMLSEQSGDVLLACASAFREMASRSARAAVTLTLPGLSISRASQYKAFLEMADSLEQEAMQRAEPDSKVLVPQTDELLDVSTGRLDFDYDYTETEAES